MFDPKRIQMFFDHGDIPGNQYKNKSRELHELRKGSCAARLEGG